MKNYTISATRRQILLLPVDLLQKLKEPFSKSFNIFRGERDFSGEMSGGMSRINKPCQFCSAKGHEFWAGDISLRNLLQQDAVLTHNQVTDLYLLGLAVHKGGKLATLDQHIPVMAIQDGADTLEVILP